MTDPPSIVIDKEGQASQGQASWVNEVKSFLLSNLQAISASYLCQGAFPPANDAARAIHASQDILALRIEELLLSYVDECLVNNTFSTTLNRSDKTGTKALFSKHNKASTLCIQPLFFKPPPPTRGEIDSGASSCMTHDFNLIKDPVKCDVEIKMVDGKTMPDDVYVGTLNAQTQQDGVAKPWPEIPIYGCKGLAFTLLSQPAMCTLGGLIHVASEKHGYFCQRDTDACPICHPDEASRIYLTGNQS